MGRPPIGKRAMTNTERSRRYRAGLATKPKSSPIANEHEVAQLKVRIAKLEQELLQLQRRVKRT
jgi:hypothetical protein